MAKYEIPYQNLSFDLPDEGEAFRDSRDGNTIGVRQGNQILSTNIEGLGQKYFTPSAGRQSYDYVPASERYQMGLRALQESGIDYNSLSQIGLDWGQLERIPGFTRGQLNDLNLLKGTPTNTGEVITQNVSPDNPHGIVVNSSSQGQIAASPSTQQALMGAGATQAQAEQLAVAQANAGQGAVSPTGQPIPNVAAPLNPGALAAAGVQPPQGVAGAPINLAGTTPAAQTGVLPQSSYTGPSIVDYLNSIGMPSDRNSRAQLALAQGIQGYRGTAEQNTQLLNSLRGGTPGGVSGMTSSTGTGGAGVMGGSPAPMPAPSPSPSDFVSNYKQISRDLGLPSIKGEFERVQQEMTDIQNELNDKITEVGDNPWLSEADRSKRVASLQNKYENKLGIAAQQAELYSTLYEQGLAEARYLATGQEEEQARLADLALKQQEAMRKLTEFDPSVFKEVQNGLFDVRSGQWIVPPKPDSGESGGSLGGLSASLQGRIMTLANGFGSSDIVKRFNATADSLNIVNGISASSKNPSDHQTIVYAFAKSLDPDSVVREGEYATIKKYAQSMLDRYGKEVTNAISGTGFLSQGAITSIKETMNRNYQSRKPAYDNLYQQTSSVIDNVAGKPVANDVLINYSMGVNTSSGNAGGGTSSNGDPESTEIGGTVVVDGIIYYKQGEDSFLPVGNAL